MKSKYLIIGAGVHGLSTAWHLAAKLKSKNGGLKEDDVLVIDKTAVAAGASGTACGVVRNNYFQPAMRELMAHSVELWESDPKAFAYDAVGFMAISPESMKKDMQTVHQQQKTIGYESDFIEGEKQCSNYMKKIFSDWQAKGITNILHEKRGGYSKSKIAIQGIAKKAQAAGAKIITGVEVTGFKRESNSSAITGAETSKGIIECDQAIIAVGPWINNFWKMLELPKTLNMKNGTGEIHKNVPMWKYWFLQEGVMKVGMDFLKMDNGDMPPLIHVDSNEPLYSDVDGSLVTDKMWGIYYKPDIVDSLGVQGGTAPYKVEKPLDQINVDPYGIASKEYQTDEKFANMWSSALAHCQKRFEGKSNLYNRVPSGGLGCFTPDNFPIFDRFCENVYIIADSNHGYKMMGVGKLVAEEILEKESKLLKPFRFSRYEQGKLHPTSSSPFPWS